jgi:hypothetical protein
MVFTSSKGLSEIKNEFAIFRTVLECLMGHQEMPLEHQDRHFNQLACDRTSASNPKFLKLGRKRNQNARRRILSNHSLPPSAMFDISPAIQVVRGSEPPVPYLALLFPL